MTDPTARRFRDADGYTWTETAPGRLEILGRTPPATFAEVQRCCGPLVPLCNACDQPARWRCDVTKSRHIIGRPAALTTT